MAMRTVPEPDIEPGASNVLACRLQHLSSESIIGLLTCTERNAFEAQSHIIQRLVEHPPWRKMAHISEDTPDLPSDLLFKIACGVDANERYECLSCRA